MKRNLCVLLAGAFSLVLAANSTFGQTFNTWQGSSNNWSNGANWSSGNVTNYGQLQFTGGGNSTSNDDLGFTLSQWRFYFSGSTAYTLISSGGNVVNLFDFSGAHSWILSDSSATQTFSSLNVNFAATSGDTFAQVSTRSSGGLAFNNLGITGSQISQLRFAGQSTGKITVNGAVSGSGKDVIIGLGEGATPVDYASTDVTFKGANTYSGTTYIVAGALHMGTGSSLSTSSIQLGQTAGSANATFALDGATGGQSFSTPMTIRSGSSGTKTITSAADGSGSANTLSGAVTVNDNFNVTSAGGGNLIFSGAVAGTSNKTMTLNGAGTTTLQGSGDNAFLQANVTSGTLVLNKASTSGVHALGGSAETVSGGTLQLSGSGGDQIQDGGSVTVSSGTFDINSRSETVAAVTLQSGSITGTSGTLTGSSYGVQSGSISAKLGGSGITLTKSTGGTVILTGANTYTGATTISAGNLQVDGSITSAVTVNGGKLSGSGTTGSVTVNSGGTLAPGTSPGILNTGNLSLALGATYLVDINGAAVAGTDYDQTNVTGTVALGNSTLTLNFTGGYSAQPGDYLTIINNDSTDLVTGTFNGLAEGATVGGYTISYVGGTGNDVVLSAPTAVPEPSTWVAGSLVAASLLVSQRRRFLKKLAIA